MGGDKIAESREKHGVEAVESIDRLAVDREQRDRVIGPVENSVGVN